MHSLPLLFAAALTPAAELDLSPAAVAAAVRPYLARHPHAAVTVGVSGPGGRAVYGFGRLPAGEAPDGRTVYEICSLTKTFTGMTLARLTGEGVVEENEPAASYLPQDLAPRVSVRRGPGGSRIVRRVTLRQLATHTAGLPLEPPSLRAAATASAEPRDPYANYDRSRLAVDLDAVWPAPPGTVSYSNIGVGLLGHALANAAEGDPLAVPATLRDRLIGPLGLRDTTFTLSADQAARFARPHRPDGTPTPPWTFATLGAAGGLRSTADDLLAFADACLGRGDRSETAVGFDPAALFREAARPRATALYDGVGLGWFVRATPHGPMAWHDGRTAGSAAYLALLTDRGVAAVVLSNAGTDVDGVVARLFGEEADGPPDPPLVRRSSPAQARPDSNRPQR